VASRSAARAAGISGALDDPCDNRAPPGSRSTVPMLSTFDRALIRVNRWIVIAILAAMASMVFANVALRFFTDGSILWVEEVSRYLMIWLTFLGAGLVLRYGGHIGIDTLQERLPRHAIPVRAVIFVVMLGFFAVMLWLGIRYAAFTWAQTTPVMQIPIGAVYLAMPIGFALLIVHALLMAASYVRERRFLGDAEFDADAVKL
jgi:TRAP-type C4-dicarboxylate transport system permease small subunit